MQIINGKLNKNIRTEDAIKIMKNSKGRIFGVEFIKRTTGELRTMSARRGVGKGVTGEGLKFDPESRQLLTVYDMNKKGHRMISTDTITGLSFQGINYSIRSTQ